MSLWELSRAHKPTCLTFNENIN